MEYRFHYAGHHSIAVFAGLGRGICLLTRQCTAHWISSTRWIKGQGHLLNDPFAQGSQRENSAKELTGLRISMRFHFQPLRSIAQG